MELHTLIYTSHTTSPVTSESLAQVAQNAAARNAVIGVTGLLLYGSGQYFQLIEGRYTAIKQLYRRICMDPRHHNSNILFESSIPYRLFPDWHMGELNLDDPNADRVEFWSKAEAQELKHIKGVSPHIKSLALIRSFMDYSCEMAG